MALHLKPIAGNKYDYEAVRWTHLLSYHSALPLPWSQHCTMASLECCILLIANPEPYSRRLSPEVCS